MTNVVKSSEAVSKGSRGMEFSEQFSELKSLKYL